MAGRTADPDTVLIAAYEKFGDTNHRAMDWLADYAKNNLDRFEKLKLKLVAYEPDAYLDLYDYFADRNDAARAEKYFLLARGRVDAVRYANTSDFLVKYYAHAGRMQEAEDFASAAAETYSGRGLAIYGWLKEFRKDWAGALALYKARDERYDHGNSGAVSFYLRRKVAREGFAPAYQPAIDAIFPRGITQVTLASFAAPPRAGMRFSTSSTWLRRAGLTSGDVVVALDGIQVENQTQYSAVREMSDSPDMNFIIWNGRE